MKLDEIIRRLDMRYHELRSDVDSYELSFKLAGRHDLLGLINRLRRDLYTVSEAFGMLKTVYEFEEELRNAANEWNREYNKMKRKEDGNHDV
ncbi:hypothetical protein B7C51_15740 [Paenibacillus larvae subsp. pulvifaciens]|uniref:Uncharacterized protein n=1 Tax=Paenibacillus larvae subsp. pulvifaciens TaxID=1477 RepID=A0A1V0UV58_9BACL|nr:hypothetical protein [Paenibacillus larvae]ARF68942.1 hypothetical protein B7C51_15740 [Paenibacillus larvae subsp. pulvifaciens]